MLNVETGHLHEFLQNIKSLPPATRQLYSWKQTYIPVTGSVRACLDNPIFTITLLTLAASRADADLGRSASYTILIYTQPRK